MTPKDPWWPLTWGRPRDVAETLCAEFTHKGQLWHCCRPSGGGGKWQLYKGTPYSRDIRGEDTPCGRQVWRSEADLTELQFRCVLIEHVLKGEENDEPR